MHNQRDVGLSIEKKVWNSPKVTQLSINKTLYYTGGPNVDVESPQAS